MTLKLSQSPQEIYDMLRKAAIATTGEEELTDTSLWAMGAAMMQLVSKSRARKFVKLLGLSIPLVGILHHPEV